MSESVQLPIKIKHNIVGSSTCFMIFFAILLCVPATLISAFLLLGLSYLFPGIFTDPLMQGIILVVNILMIFSFIICIYRGRARSYIEFTETDIKEHIERFYFPLGRPKVIDQQIQYNNIKSLEKIEQKILTIYGPSVEITIFYAAASQLYDLITSKLNSIDLLYSVYEHKTHTLNFSKDLPSRYFLNDSFQQKRWRFRFKSGRPHGKMQGTFKYLSLNYWHTEVIDENENIVAYLRKPDGGYRVYVMDQNNKKILYWGTYNRNRYKGAMGLETEVNYVFFNSENMIIGAGVSKGKLLTFENHIRIGNDTVAHRGGLFQSTEITLNGSEKFISENISFSETAIVSVEKDKIVPFPLVAICASSIDLHDRATDHMND